MATSVTSRIETSRSIRPFDGDGDIVAWLSKVELVAKLSSVKDAALLVPMFLEGGALALYLELDESKKNDYSALSRELIRAYSDSQSVSFCKLKAAQWTGEPVEVFANNLRRMARGCGLEKEGLEQVVKLAFINGFPDSISVELQQVEGVDSMVVSQLINRARILATSGPRFRSSVSGDVAAVTVTKVGEKKEEKKDDEKKKEFECYRCGSDQHGWKRCPHPPLGKKREEVTFAGCAL